MRVRMIVVVIAFVVAVLVPAGQWRQLQQVARPTLKELLLAEDARGDLAITERGGRRRREPSALA